MQTKTFPSSKVIIVFEKKLLLILRDNDRSIHDPNRWSLVGGMVDKGETFEETIKREMKEEIDVVPKSLKKLGEVKTPDGSNHGIFFARLTEDEKDKLRLGNEGQKLGFFTVDEMANLDLAAVIRIYCDKHAKYLKRVVEDGEFPDPNKLELS